MDSPTGLPILLSISVFYFLVFLFSAVFSLVPCIWYIKLTHVGF